MEVTIILLAWSVNLLVGLGFVLLGAAMLRRPEKLWLGIRVARGREDLAKIRRANFRTGPLLLIFGLTEILSGPAAMAAHMSDISLAFVGLGTLLVAIVTTVLSVVISS